MKMVYAMALLLKIPKELPMAKPNYSFEKTPAGVGQEKEERRKAPTKTQGERGRGTRSAGDRHG